MKFMYWWRMQELAMNIVKVPNTMFVRQEIVMYLKGNWGRGGGSGRAGYAIKEYAEKGYFGQ